MTKCKLCGSPSQQLKHKKLYHVCGNCELIWLDERDVLAPGPEKERYLEHNNDPDNQGYRKMFMDFLDMVESRCKGQRALDFGSGPGPVLAGILRDRGWDVDIYDPYFAPDEAFKQCKYNLVTCTEVMEHVSDPLITWRSLVERLDTGGVLAVMTHFHPGVQKFKDWWYIRDATHVGFYNRITMEWLAQELGLKMLFCDDFKTTLFSLKR